MKKKRKKAKWSSEEALQTAEEEKRNKKQGRKGKVYQLNEDFQRTAQRDKMALFSEQCVKLKKTTQGGRLEVSSGKLEISREHFKDEHNKGQKW